MKDKRKEKIKEYIQAVDMIIKEKGKDAVTIRNVGEKLKNNSALLYKYFSSLEHLLFMHSIGILSNYAKRLKKEVYSIKDPLLRYFGIWNLFAEESFKAPKEYYNLFFTKESEYFNGAVNLYYEIFPDILDNTPEEVMPMLLERHLYKRDYKALEVCAKHGYLKQEDLKEINFRIMLMYQSMLIRARDSLLEFENSKAHIVMMKFIKKIVNEYRLDLK